MDTIGINPMMLGAAAVMVAVSALVFGLWPAIDVSRHRDLTRALRSGARSGAAERARDAVEAFSSSRRSRSRSSCSWAPACSAARWLQLQGLEMGFAIGELGTVELSLPAPIASSRPRLTAFYQVMTDRFTRLPGVSSATVVLLAPFSGLNGWDAFYTAEGQSAVDAAANPALDLQAVLPSLFLDHGSSRSTRRGITASDREGSSPVAVVSQSLARRAWPGQDPDRQATQVRARGCARGRGSPSLVSRPTCGTASSRFRGRSCTPVGATGRHATAHVRRLAWPLRVIRSALADAACDERGRARRPGEEHRTMRQRLTYSLARPRFNARCSARSR